MGTLVERRAALGLVAYVVRVGSLFTPLYEPLWAGHDDAWILLVLLVAAHLGLGITLARGWALVFPVALAVLCLVVGVREGYGLLMLVYGLPVLSVLTAFGWAAGRVMRRPGVLVPVCAALFVVASVAPVWATIETVRRGPELPPGAQARLPTGLRLTGLCLGREVSPATRRDLRRRAGALLRELRLRPSHLVAYTTFPEGTPEQMKVTVRELAEEQLELFEWAGPGCAPTIRRRLAAAL